MSWCSVVGATTVCFQSDKCFWCIFSLLCKNGIFYCKKTKKNSFALKMVGVPVIVPGTRRTVSRGYDASMHVNNIQHGGIKLKEDILLLRWITMHFSIPDTVELKDRSGSTYLVSTCKSFMLIILFLKLNKLRERYNTTTFTTNKIIILVYST